MPSLVEQFKQALVSKKALEAFSSAFKEGYINPLDWAIDEITQLNREYSQLFALDDYHFIEERILFNQNFAQLLERVCLDCKDLIKKDLFAQTNFLCANYIQSIQKGQKSKKRPLEKPTLPKPKKRRLSSTLEQIDASKLQHLTELGYAPTHARAILSSKRARPNYYSLTRWHELFINLFSHEQLVQITLEGGESSFIALSEYLLPLVNYRFSSQDIFRLIKKPKASARIACIFNHMDDLVMRGFNYQQLVIMGESEYAIHNLPQINEKIYAFHGDEVTEFVSKSPPEFFY